MSSKKHLPGLESYRDFRETGPWLERDNVEKSFLSKETTRGKDQASNHWPSGLEYNMLMSTTLHSYIYS